MIDLKLLSKAVKYILKNCYEEFKEYAKDINTDSSSYNECIIKFYNMKVGG